MDTDKLVEKYVSLMHRHGIASLKAEAFVELHKSNKQFVKMATFATRVARAFVWNKGKM